MEEKEEDTGTGIATTYYGDPAAWSDIKRYNSSILRYGLQEGQRLKLPVAKGTNYRESSFVLELAYKKAGDQLGPQVRQVPMQPAGQLLAEMAKAVVFR